ARPVLLRIFENAEPFEPRPLDEFQQRRERLLGFAGKTDDECRAQSYAWNSRAQSVNQLFDMRPAGLASHPSEHSFLDVLERHVDVARDLAASRDRLD